MAQVTLYPTKDNHTGATGTNDYVHFGNYGSNFTGFIAFDLSSIPAGAYIVSATMYLRSYTGSFPSAYGSYNFSIHRISSQWSESQNPSYSSSIGTRSYYWGGTYGYFGVDVTDSTREFVAGTYSNYGWAINAITTNFMLEFRSREHTDKPYLIVEYNLPPNAPTVTSPNGSEVIDKSATITWSASTDSDTSASSLKYQIQLSTDNGGTWKDLVSLTSAGITSYTYNFQNEQASLLSKIRVRSYDGYSYSSWDESNAVFTIQHNVAPTTPTNLTPTGIAIDKDASYRFTWKHNDSIGDSQSKFVLQWRVQGNATWNSVTQTTPNEYWDAPSGTFPAGTIEWQVQTFDQESQGSPFSAVAVFTATVKPPAPVFTSPTNNAVITVPQPSVSWTSAEQVEYNIQVLLAGVSMVWGDTVTTTTKTVQIGYKLQTGQTYKIKIRIKNSSGIYSDFAERTISTLFTPPTKATVTASTNFTLASITLSITNAGTGVATQYNDIYRKKPTDDDFIRVATVMGVNEPYTDYTPAHNQPYQYFVRAYGSDGAYSDSDVVSASVPVNDIQLAMVRDPMKRITMNIEPSMNEDGAVEMVMMQFAGRKNPIAEFGESESLSLDVSFEVETLEEVDLVRLLAYSREILLYRDSRGRREFVVLNGASIIDHQPDYYEVKLKPIRTHFTEGV